MTLPIVSIDREMPYPPRISRTSTPFWTALGEGRFLLPHCPACDAHHFPPLAYCPDCGDRSPGGAEARGTGKLYALTTVHAGPPALLADGPYTRAIIDLDEGVRMIAEWHGDKDAAFDTAIGLIVVRYRNGCLFGARSAGG